MAAVFLLRIAVGLMGCLLLLSPGSARGERPIVNQRYFRTHFLITVGLACAALLLVRSAAGWPLLCAAGAGLALAFAGSVAWSLEGAPAGRALIVLTGLALTVGLGLQESALNPDRPIALLLVGSMTSAALLGAALSAMLLGHLYLISPTMTLGPLFRLLTALAVALGVRLAADGYALACWTSRHSLDSLKGDTALWLPVRWGVGFVAPLALTWMAWQTARIRSTQSATGILYVVVIFCFLGELTAQLLRPGGMTL
jgi:hypothetical protein